jgi:drug/metabolite transporter (DMT)-like permease
MPITFIAVEVTAVGAVIFGFEFLRDHGYKISAMWENIPPRAWTLVVTAGLLNMVGFLFQITGLRYTMVARAQMISVAQIVIGTLFGVFFFCEETNMMIWFGVILTVLGIFIISMPENV